MNAVTQWLEDGNIITELPEQPPQKYLTGSLKMHLIAQLQSGDKTHAELKAYFGNENEVRKAYQSANFGGCPVYKDNGVYSLEPFEEKVIDISIDDTPKSMTEKQIVEILGKWYFKNALVELNNYFWTGFECDILAISKSLRPIEIEIKVSQADFLKDRKKDKWDKKLPMWKHYYLMPENIYHNRMIAKLPHPECGILTLAEVDGKYLVRTQKPAGVISDIKISIGTIIDIVRILNQRYWRAMA